NGAGKSTLLRILAGQIDADGGERVVTPGTRIAYVPQEPAIEGATVLDHATGGGAEPHRAEAALQAFGLDPAKSTQGLSGGEARRRRLDSMRQAKADRLKEARSGLNMGLASSGIAGKRVAEVKAITKAFGDRIILKPFSTRILRGDRVAVVGPNGAGKTTLVK